VVLWCSSNLNNLSCLLQIEINDLQTIVVKVNSQSWRKVTTSSSSSARYVFTENHSSFLYVSCGGLLWDQDRTGGDPHFIFVGNKAHTFTPNIRLWSQKISVYVTWLVSNDLNFFVPQQKTITPTFMYVDYTLSYFLLYHIRIPCKRYCFLSNHIPSKETKRPDKCWSIAIDWYINVV